MINHHDKSRGRRDGDIKNPTLTFEYINVRILVCTVTCLLLYNVSYNTLHGNALVLSNVPLKSEPLSPCIVYCPLTFSKLQGAC